MKKKYIMLALLSSFIFHNNIFTMKQEVENIPYIPYELIAKIIRHVVEDHIKNWNGITDFQIIKRQIARDLLNNHLVSKSFSEFHKYGKFNIEYVDSVIKEIDQKSQDKILAASINRKEQTVQLIEALNKRNQQEITDSINKGADVNAKNDFNGATALQMAVASRNKDIVELLIESGADVNAKNDFDGATALQMAVKSDNKDIVELLIESGVNNIDEPDKLGYTALIFAAAFNRIEIVKLLIQLGTNIDKSNSSGFTALMWAAIGGHIDMVKLLIDKGASVNAVDKCGNTALRWAKNFERHYIVELLMNNGTNN